MHSFRTTKLYQSSYYQSTICIFQTLWWYKIKTIYMLQMLWWYNFKTIHFFTLTSSNPSLQLLVRFSNSQFISPIFRFPNQMEHYTQVQGKTHRSSCSAQLFYKRSSICSSITIISCSTTIINYYTIMLDQTQTHKFTRKILH